MHATKATMRIRQSLFMTAPVPERPPSYLVLASAANVAADTRPRAVLDDTDRGSSQDRIGTLQGAAHSTDREK
jgi:hypothetical protein